MFLPQLLHHIQSTLPQAQSAWLFGSAARNELRSDSDIDMAVLFEHGQAPDAWALRNLAQELARLVGRNVDLINIQSAPSVLQKEIIEARHRLFAKDVEKTENFELFALSQYRDYNERFATEFAKVAATGKVYG
jgi:uncharacterized protein